MTDLEITTERIAYAQECIDDTWQLTVLMKTTEGITSAYTPIEGPSWADVVRQGHERWPDLNIVSHEEWDKVFYRKWGGRPSGFIGGGTGKRMESRAGRSPRSLPTPRAPRDHPEGVSSTPSTPESHVPMRSKRNSIYEARAAALDDDVWLPAVEAAKTIGVPPQYIYNLIYHGKLKSQGERPKKVRWGDVKRRYGR